MFKPVLIAAAISLAVLAVPVTASALPAGPASKPGVDASSNLVEVGKRYKGYRGHSYRGHRGYRGYHYRGGRHYHHHHHYRYRNWHRYSYAPYGWRSRGCIVIGPIWYCP